MYIHINTSIYIYKFMYIHISIYVYTNYYSNFDGFRPLPAKGRTRVDRICRSLLPYN